MGSSPTDLPPAAGLVGRDVELDAVRALTAGVQGPIRALVIEGDPGVGKTSLWEQGMAWARDAGMRVLVTRGSESETALPFTGLIDLLDGVSDEELAPIPVPQLRALKIALYRADPAERPPEPQVIAVALLSALRVLAARQPLLVAVDDSQWLDRASAQSIVYAARRLDQEQVRFLLARRPGLRADLDKAFTEGRVDQIVVGPTSLGAIRQILATRLGLRMPHDLLRRVYETSLGNPLFAIELGRTLTGRDLDRIGAELPVPDNVDDLLGLRVADLDPPVRRVLLALSLDADLRVSQLRDLAGEAAVASAIEAGVVDLDGDRARPAHPLLAAAAMRQASEDERRDLHRRLAEVVADEQRRALHLALAAEVPDGELADRIGAAAEMAAARGATRLGVDLAAHAYRLTPPDTVDVQRVLTLARHLHDAAETRRLTDLLSDRMDSLPHGAARVTAYLLLTNGVVDGNDELLALLEKALAEAGDDQLLRGRVLCYFAENEAAIEVRGLATADARASEAMAYSRQGSPEDRRTAAYALAWTQALRGRPVDDLIAEHASGAAPSGYLARGPARVAAQRLVWRGELEGARALLEPLRAEAEERGEFGSAALARLHLCELELRAGRWGDAEALLVEWAASTDSDLLGWPMYERCRALLAAGRGDVDDVRRWGSRAAKLAETDGVRWDWLEASRALGTGALLDKDLDGAVHHLRAVWEHTQREGVLDPGAFPAAPELVEALVETESYDEARAVVGTLEEAAAAQDHPWARAGARRGAALVQIHGDSYSETAAESLEAAATSYRELGLEFDAARALLSLGRAQRRARKWGAARDVLDRAVASFEELGSPGWAADARAERERVGARRPTAEGGLTPTERRVVGLAVDSLSNKEIARELVVTVNTVEFHLRNAYAKLGIRSRAQLPTALREHQ